MFHVELDVSPVSRVQRFGRCMSNSNRPPHFTTEKIVTNSRVRLSFRRACHGTLPWLISFSLGLLYYDRPLAHFHSSGSARLRRLCEACRWSSSLQGVVEVQFPFRRHYARRCHYCSHARLRPTRGHEDWTGRGAAARSRHFG